jgi:protein gp37
MPFSQFRGGKSKQLPIGQWIEYAAARSPRKIQVSSLTDWLQLRGRTMGENSKIEWTDSTWNPVRGCTKVSPGCKHCYAETWAERFRGVKGSPFEQGFDLQLVPHKLTEPLRWKKSRRIFVNSMSDLFQEDVPTEYIARVGRVIEQAHWHTYQVLTKRHERMRILEVDPKI